MTASCGDSEDYYEWECMAEIQLLLEGKSSHDSIHCFCSRVFLDDHRSLYQRNKSKATFFMNFQFRLEEHLWFYSAVPKEDDGDDADVDNDASGQVWNEWRDSRDKFNEDGDRKEGQDLSDAYEDDREAEEMDEETKKEIEVCFYHRSEATS